MQRIDDNTYIDDTLVTCAEYQLFIDEMREQGKYYQPDHWTSYQFPEGQAREPILGVRKSDAVSFCNWLTRRENGKWNYRLPTTSEAKRTSLKPISQPTPLGYWVNRDEEQNQFNWVGSSPKENIYTSNNQHKDITTTVKYRNIFSDLLIKFKKRHTKLITHTVKSYIESILTSKQGKPINLDQYIPYFLNTTHDKALELDIRMFLGKDESIRANDLLNSIIDDINRSSNYPNKFDIAVSFAKLFIAEYDDVQVKPHTQKYAPSLARYYNRPITSALGLAADFFVIQERIAGRSPAFEGIRLVKERIR